MDRLIIFTRYPEPGKAKTRLIPALGEDGAAELQRQMSEYIVNRLRCLADGRRVEIEIRYVGTDEEQMRSWLGPDLVFRAQGGGDLGERMARAFGESFHGGAGEVVLIGTDCPGVTPDLVETAFAELRRADVVLGPALDGGYHLVGMRKDLPALFRGIPWGTAEVFERTLAVAQALGATVALVDRLQDVDRPEDLPVWERASPLDRISVIIPTLNEADNIAFAIESAKTGTNVEIIVADAGSEDGTAEVVRALGVEVIRLSPGRAEQQNSGAARATGGILLFLHGDCTLPRDFDRDIRRALARPGVVAGGFHLRIDMDHWGIRTIEALGNWRSRVWGLPYGDQGLFLRKTLFDEIGGFPDMEIMEDYVLMRTLSRRGRVAVLPTQVTAHSRRWKSMGILRTTLINQAIILGHFLRVPPRVLAKWYRREEGWNRPSNNGVAG
jgi:rSAM/selenodomain-associated transferase 2/rSAM/selenodomain-associated transferase 1